MQSARTVGVHISQQMVRCVVIALLVLSTWSFPVFAAITSSDRISSLIANLASDGLRLDTLQSEFDGLAYDTTTIDGPATLDELALKLSQKFQTIKGAVLKLKSVVESELASASGRGGSLTECCRKTGVTYDSRFGSEIDVNSQCERLSGSADSSYYNVGPRLLDIFKRNLAENPTLKWQVFGSEHGLITLYPSFKTSDCSSYDPRFRPFYAAAAVPEPRDIVIVIDHSGSMSDHVGSSSRMELAKQAAKTVLDTLNPKDNVGVVGFSSSASGRRGCYSHSLAEATEANIAELKSYVDDLSAAGLTNYEAALQLAFTQIEAKSTASQTGGNRHKVILFLTDGEPTGRATDIMQTIYDHNSKLGFSVVILTYGMHIDRSSQAAQILNDMALQNYQSYGIRSSGSPPAGKSDIVSSDQDIRLQMGSYYAFFEPDIEVIEPVVTVPYYDAFGLGVVTTVAIPVYVGSGSTRRLAGVVGVDVTLADLVEDVTYFRRGELSYAFVIDKTGVTLMHPLMPAPSDVTSIPQYIDIDSLESSNGSKAAIWSSMKNGGSGTLVVDTEWPVSRGNSLTEGVRISNVRATYRWKPIDRTDFSVGLVIAEQYNFEKLPRHLTPPRGSDFLYHRFDLVPPTVTTCNQFGRLAVSNKVSVKIAPEGFKNPFEYLDLPENATRVRQYVDYFNGRTNTNLYFKPSIRTSLLVISRIEDDWLRGGSDFTPYIVWRYIGTPDGVFVILPGAQQVKEYDHTKRQWYQRAIAFPGQSTLSAPTLDSYGAGYVVTLSHTVTDGSATNPEVLAVASMDFTLPYFWTMLTDQYSDCRSNGDYHCFVIDSAGYLIIHESFVDPETSIRDGVEGRHVAEMEPGVARLMIANNLLERGQCNNYQDERVQYFYTVRQGTYTSPRSTCPSMKMFPIRGTNAYLVVVDKLSCSGQTYSPCNCPSASSSSSVRQCQRLGDLQCGCPCGDLFDYNKCDGLPSLHSHNTACPPPPPSLALPPIRRTATGPSCSGVPCDRSTTHEDCFGVVGCEWCSYDYSTRRALSQPFCADSKTCPLGAVDGPTLYAPISVIQPTASDADDSSNTAAVAGAVAGVIVVVIVVVALLVLWRKKHKCNQTRNEQGNSDLALRHTERPPPVNTYKDTVPAPTAPPPPGAYDPPPSYCVAANYGGPTGLPYPPSNSTYY